LRGKITIPPQHIEASAERVSEARQLPNFRETVVLRDFLTVQEHKQLMYWADTQLARGHLTINPYGEHRWFRSYGENDPLVPSVFWKVRRRAVATFSVRDYDYEPDYRCFLGCNTEGGYVHRHIDSSPPGKLHVRMNLMLSKPVGGGMPVIGSKEFDIEERDLWCFFPSIMPHESTPVMGDRKRFVASIGILVPNTMFGGRKPQISN
jgi:hypothetical protein